VPQEKGQNVQNEEKKKWSSSCKREFKILHKSPKTKKLRNPRFPPSLWCVRHISSFTSTSIL
jgi:hypothetical protein